MGSWCWNHVGIPNEETLYRKIKPIKEMCTWDPVRGSYVPTPGALRRQAYEGLSTHAKSILDDLGRNETTLYDQNLYSAIAFTVGVVRSTPGVEVGVIFIEADEKQEKDEDLRRAHAEVRPKAPEKNRQTWSEVVHQIVQNHEWIPQQRGI